MVNKTIQQINQKEMDLSYIIKCFYNTCLKYKKEKFELPYDYVVTCLSDWRNIKRALVKEYLEILKIRKIIKIKKLYAQEKVIEYELKIKTKTFDTKIFRDLKKWTKK